jgi:hypothetical protein
VFKGEISSKKREVQQLFFSLDIKDWDALSELGTEELFMTGIINPNLFFLALQSIMFLLGQLFVGFFILFSLNSALTREDGHHIYLYI